MASSLSWIVLLLHLLSQYRPSWQLTQSSYLRESSAAVVDHFWNIISGLSHLLVALVRRCMTCPVREWSWVACGDPSWAGASRLSVLGQVQVDGIQLLHPLLVLFTLEVTGSENFAHNSFCSICTSTEPRSVTYYSVPKDGKFLNLSYIQCTQLKIWTSFQSPDCCWGLL